MKINFSGVNPKYYTSAVKKYNSVKSFASNPEKLPQNVEKVLSAIAAAKNGFEASKILARSDFAQKNGVLFKSGDIFIQNIFSSYGREYENNLKKLNKMNLSIVPEHIKTIEKDSDMFIVTRIKGTKTGDLIPYLEAENTVSKEDKMSAYNDLVKLTKAGYTDNNVLRFRSQWFVTPEDHKIVIPMFENLRPLKFGESNRVLESYKQILFE